MEALSCLCVLRRGRRRRWTALNGASLSAPWMDRGTSRCNTHFLLTLLHSKSLPLPRLPLRLSLGDWAGSLPLGEASWPLVYGAAVDLLGSDLVHRYVGVDGFSAYDSPFTLTRTGPPPAVLIDSQPAFTLTADLPTFGGWGADPGGA